jgi:hypothetical protein
MTAKQANSQQPVLQTNIATSTIALQQGNNVLLADRASARCVVLLLEFCS